RNALDGEDIVAVRLHRKHQAGACRALVEQNGAGAANAVLAAKVRAGETKLMADEIGEGDADLDLFLVPLSVDGQGDFATLSHLRALVRMSVRVEQARVCLLQGPPR